MKKMKRQFLGVFCALTFLLVLLSLPALASDLPTELWVNGVNILENPEEAPMGVSYNAETGVLTLENAEITQAGSSSPAGGIGIYSDRALTIVLKGQNSIRGADIERGILLDSGALTLSGEGSLSVAGKEVGIFAYAGVTVENSVSELTVSGAYRAFSAFDGSPITIGGKNYNSYDNLYQLVTVEKGTLVSNVSLPTQLWVNGVNILTNPGDAPQGVSYDAAMGVLTLEGAEITQAGSSYPAADFGIYSDRALTIVLKGQNSIDGDGIECGIFLDNGSLTLSGDGSLEVSGKEVGIAAYAGVTVENSVSELTVSGAYGAFSAYDDGSIAIGGEKYDPSDDLYQLVTVKKGTLVSNKWLPLTELWVNGVDILDPSATLPTGVSYNTETGVLTLENVAIDTAEPYYGIIYADSALTIELKGKNSLVGEGAEYGIYLGNGALTLSGDGSLSVAGKEVGIAAYAGVTVEDSVSELTVSGPSGAFSTSDGAPITIGGENYDPSDDLYLLVTVKNGTLVSNEWLPLTELWVNGVNILENPEEAPMGVSYDAKTGVLTLNNAAITQGYLYDSSNSYSAGIYANGSLSIVLKGSSSIAAPENGNTFFDGIAMYSGSLNISGDGSLAITALGGDSDGIYLQESSLIMKDCTLDITADYDGIYSDRSVTLTGCTLDIAADDDGIYSDRSVTLTGCTLDIAADDDGIYCSDSVTLTDCTLDITADYDGLYSDRSVTLTDCTLDIAAGDDGIDCSGSATLTGCTLDIAAGDDGIDCSDSVTLTGCTLNIAADWRAISASEDIRLSNGSATVSSGVNCFSSNRLLLENNSTVLFCNSNAVDTGEFTLSGGSLTLAYGTFVRKTPTLENQPEIVNNGYLSLQDADALQQAEISGTGILSFDNASDDRFFDNAGSSIVSQDRLSLEVGTSDESEKLGYSWQEDEDGNWVLHLKKPMVLQSALTIVGEQNGDSVVIRTDSLCRIDNLSLEGDSGLSVTFEGSAPLCVAGFSNECPVTSLTVAEGAEVSILDGFSGTDAELTVDGTLAIWGISAKKLTVGAEGQLFLLGDVGLSLTGGAGALTLEEGAQLSAFCDTTALFLTADKTLSPQEVIVLPEGYLPEGFELCRVEGPGGDGIFTAVGTGEAGRLS